MMLTRDAYLPVFKFFNRDSRRIFGSQANKFSNKVAQMTMRAAVEKRPGEGDPASATAATSTASSSAADVGLQVTEYQQLVSELRAQVGIMSKQLEKARASSGALSPDGEHASTLRSPAAAVSYDAEREGKHRTS